MAFCGMGLDTSQGPRPTGDDLIPAKVKKPEERELKDIVPLVVFALYNLVALIMGFVAVGSAKSPSQITDLQCDCLEASATLANCGNAGTTSGSVEFNSDKASGFDLLEREPGVAVASVFIALVLGLGWLYLLKAYTKVMVWGTIGMSLVVWVAAIIYGFAAGSVAAGAIYAVMFLLECLWLYCVRHHINLSAELLSLAVECLAAFPATLGAHALVCLAILSDMILTIVFIVSASLMFTGFDEATCSQPQQSPLASPIMYIVVIKLMWNLAFFAQARLFISAFVFGNWYFHPESERVANPVLAGLQLAVTKHLGSLALAGIIVAIIDYLKGQMRRMMRSANCFYILIGCIIMLVLRALEFLTSFTTIMVAFSGDDFITAAGKGFKALKHSFVAGYVTDRYSKLTLRVGGVALSILIGFICWAISDGVFGTESLQNILFVILFLVLTLLGAFGLLVGIIIAFVASGDIAIMALAVIFATSAQMILLFLAVSLIDLTAAAFGAYAVDKAHMIQSFNGGQLHTVVYGFGAKNGSCFGADGKPVETEQAATVNPAGGASQKV